MEKLKLRLVAASITVVMAATQLAGCSTGDKTATQTTAPTMDASKPTYPIATADKPITLKIWSPADAILKYYKDLNETVAFQEMEKATGVKINWIHPAVAQSQEAFNLMIASRDLPDAINYTWGKNVTPPSKYADDGIIIPITDYLKYAPNFSELINQNNGDSKKRISDDSGKIYYFPLLYPELTGRTYNGYMIRQDWLDKVGMKIPTNTDELEAVLKAFQDKDVNGSGKKDEYFGFTGFKKAGFTPETIIWSFGSDVNMIQDKGKVVFGPMTPEFKEGLAYLAKLYNEGLIDPEYMLNDETKLKQKYVSDNIAGSMGSAARVVQYTALLTPKNPAAKMVPIPSLKNPKGTGYWFNENTISATNTAICLAITTANKHVAETMAWQDWVYTKAGAMAFNFGREGDTYTMVNNQPTFTDKITKDPKGRTQSEMVNITATGQGIWPTAQDLTAAKLATTPEAWSCFEIWGKNLPDTSKIKPTVLFNDAELAVVTAKRQAITDYVEQMVDRFVVGKEPLDNYEKVFLPKLKELGIDDLVKANQTALDRYNKR